MIQHILQTSLISLALGFLIQLLQTWLGSTYLNGFFKQNLITLLVALLAVNSATMGIVLTKIRDLVEIRGHGDTFTNTRCQMILAVREQIVLIMLAAVFLIIEDSAHIASLQHIHLLLQSIISGIFAYAMMILYDTAKSVLIIIDFND